MEDVMYGSQLLSSETLSSGDDITTEDWNVRQRMA
jgi:hypothetical protein